MYRISAQVYAVGPGRQGHIHSPVDEHPGTVGTDRIAHCPHEIQKVPGGQVLLPNLNGFHTGFGGKRDDLKRPLTAESLGVGDQIGAKRNGQSSIPSMVVLADA